MVLSTRRFWRMSTADTEYDPLRELNGDTWKSLAQDREKRSDASVYAPFDLGIA